jgi:hypothetical protein
MRGRTPMQLRRLAPAVLMVLLVGCTGGSSTPPPPPIPTTSTPIGPTKTGSPLPQVLTHVVFDQTIHGHYAQPVRSFVRITGGGIHRTLQIPNIGSRLLDLHRAATYSVRSFQQPCRSNCEHLRPPVDGCGTTFPASGEVVRLTIVVTPGSGCTITRS